MKQIMSKKDFRAAGCRPYIVTNRLLARKAPLARPTRRLVPLPKKSHDFSGTPLGLCDINSALQSQRAAGCRPYGFKVFVIIFRDDVGIVPYTGNDKPFPYNFLFSLSCGRG